LTTEKDGVRLSAFPEFLREIYLLHIEMSIIPEGRELTGLILSKLKKGALRAER
jgi:hypothetical protein